MNPSAAATANEALPGSDMANKLLVGPIRLAAKTLWDLTIEGLENIPADGPAILTPNHLSFCDSVFVPVSLPRRMWAIGKGEYMDDWKTKFIFPALGMIPVDRSGGDAAQVALNAAARVLDAGNLFMMYPEGTRSRSGHLHKGRTGPARLSLRCGAPIVPVGHQGTVAVQPPDYPLMKPFKKVTVRFGAPMRVEDHGDPDDPRTMRIFTDAVMFQVAQLSGQQYVHTYANAPEPETTDVGPTSPASTGATSPASSGAGIPTPPGRIALPPRRPVPIVDIRSASTAPAIAP